VLFVSVGKVIVGIASWDNADASADIAAACADTVEDTRGVSSDGEYRRQFCEVVERFACCVSGMEQFSNSAEVPFPSCVSKVVDVDTTEVLGADELAAVVSLDCVTLEVLDV
jgi:type IV secretory pathway TrbF-like protein